MKRRGRETVGERRIDVEDVSATSSDAALPADGAGTDERREGTRLGYLIHDVSRMRRLAYDHFMRPLGITRAQWWVLAHLSRQDGMGQTQLAEVMEVGKASLGDVIDCLENGGWVVRRTDAVDKRAKRVWLTRAAQALVLRMADLEDQFNGAILTELSPSERAELTALLGKIKHSIARIAPGLAPAKV